MASSVPSAVGPSPDPGHRARWRPFTEPPRPARVRRRPRAHYLALGTVCVGAFMGQLDASIVTVALPTLQRDFHTAVASVTWVGLSYLIVLVGGVTAVGRLADMVGRKLLYTYGFVIFTVGSGLCALSPSLGVLDAFRVVQASGAALLQANSIAIVALVMPRERLGRGLGIQGAAQAVGLALGPTLGGLLLSLGGWRLLFLINIPAGILGTAAGWLLLPRSRQLQVRRPFDWIGLALFLPAVVGTVVDLSFAHQWGWGSPRSIGTLVVVVASAGGFVAWERRAPAPMIELSLFGDLRFRRGVVAGMLGYLVLFGTMASVPFFLQRARHAGSGATGLTLSVLPLMLGAVAVLSGRSSDRARTRPLTVAGMAVSAASLTLLGLHPGDGTLLAGQLALVGLGLGLFMAPNNTSVMASVPPSHAGTASGVVNTARGLGAAFGLAVVALVYGRFSARVSSAVFSGRFTISCLGLAALAAVAALLASCRDTGSAAPEGTAIRCSGSSP